MKIYSMTATFGKLEHETLTLQPGLNVLYAPNEWGKSTWCAFLVAMLYGLDTRAKTTKTVLADKERFAPWSGSPMEGRMDLNWNGRDITIERRSKGRVPLGKFRAYETASGLEIPELTAANCGQMLLGVEQSIFRRSGFIRLTDLPVTQDEALRSRLNALVTTGDESGDAVRLAEELRDLKNRCRYNRSGLLPQALGQAEELTAKIEEIQTLESQIRKLREREDELAEWNRLLENHRVALSYTASQEDARRVAEARDVRDQAVQRMEALEASCAGLPSREEAEPKEAALRELILQWNALQLESRILPAPPIMQEVHPAFRGMTPAEATAAAERDGGAYRRSRGKIWLIFVLLGVIGLLGGLGLMFLNRIAFAAASGGLGLFGLCFGFGQRVGGIRRSGEIAARYGSNDPTHWLRMARSFEKATENYEKEVADYQSVRADAEGRMEALNRQRSALCGTLAPEKMQEKWRGIVSQWDAFYTARREAQQAEKYLQTLQSMVKPGQAPAVADDLTYSERETVSLMGEAQAQQQRLHSRAEQYRGRMEALGDPGELRRQLSQTEKRIEKLEDTYAALTIAQETLAAATAELQRRFAPQISQRAQELLGAMTDGRYDRLTLSEDFSLRAGAQREDTLHDALWRSDGTVDQLYLALRLAVFEALTPNAPLILDDALVRFDDDRMKAALKLLRDMASERQILLFTCQHREESALTVLQ